MSAQNNRLEFDVFVVNGRQIFVHVRRQGLTIESRAFIDPDAAFAFVAEQSKAFMEEAMAGILSPQGGRKKISTENLPGENFRPYP